jgi:hypothetical protein
MAQQLATSFVVTSVPGAYSQYTVQNTSLGIAANGIVAIVGEADGGESYTTDLPKNNAYGPDQLDAIVSKYTSGQIVDAFRALTAPSNDTGITGAPSLIYVVKTNTGTKASATLATTYGSISQKVAGVIGNNTQYKVTAAQAEVAPVITGATIASFGAALNGVSFTIRYSGSAAVVITLSGTPANHSDIATLVAEVNGLLTAATVPVTASAGVTNRLVLTYNSDAAANGKAWGKSLELFDSTSGDLAKLGLVAGLYISSAEPSVNLLVSNATTGANETLTASADVVFTLGYVGTSALLTIDNSDIAVTVVGGSGASFTAPLSQFTTLTDLASWINVKTGFTCVIPPAGSQLSPSALDKVTALPIASSGTGLCAGRVKRGLINFKNALLQSTTVDFTATATGGLPIVTANYTFFTGGARGGTSGANFVSAIATLEGVATNFVVPLFSQDATADITAGVTAPSSTYTIAAINTATKNHCISMSTPILKRNRQGVLSFKGTFANAAAASQGIANYRCSMAFQDVNQINSQGNVVQYQPWYSACVAAGMQAAGFYKGITNKFANVISYVDPSDFDSGSPSDVEQALLSGLLILQASIAGNKWVSDQTTYGYDTNFVYNSLQAVYAADVVSLDLAQSFQNTFVGQSLADVSASSGLAFLSSKMDQYYKLKLITGSSDAPAGYKNAKVSISGPTMSVSVEIKLATTLYFVAIQFVVSEVQQSAG